MQSDALSEIVAELELRTEFEPAVLREAAGAPAILEESGLCDKCEVPYVTIDGPSSRDLDQAVHCERTAQGLRINYAIADAAAFAPPDGALFAEALARGATYYLPGLAVPMLPRTLSEDQVSLGQDVKRRALVFQLDLDATGALLSTTLYRAHIKSVGKLSFPEVQAFYDQPEQSLLGQHPAADSLRLLREIGELRQEIARTEGAVRFRRREVDIVHNENGFSAVLAPRLAVEIYNEHISILANREAGRLLLECPAPHLQPIFRVHPPPDEGRLLALRALGQELLSTGRLTDPRGVFDPHQGLAAFLNGMPDELRDAPLGRALERQAVLVNLRSSFSTEAAPHFGVGAEIYARATSPMREVVGVFVHKELCEMIGALPPTDPAQDLALREQVVLSANRAKELQRRVSDRVTRLIVDREFSAVQREGRELCGTVMGLSTSKVFVELDDPPLDIKLYLRDLGAQRAGAFLELSPGGALLRERETEKLVCAVGDVVNVRVIRHDTKHDRWVLDLVSVSRKSLAL